MRRKIICIITLGRLGDILLTTPVIAVLRKKYPRSVICVLARTKEYKDIFINNPNIDRVRISDDSFKHDPITFILYKLRLAKFYDFHYGRLCPNLNFNKGATRIIADVFDVTAEDTRVQLFLTEKEERKAKTQLADFHNPVLLHINSITSKNQEWLLENWETLVAAMPECSFIQLGLTGEEKVKGAIDWLGKLSFRECLGLFKFAAAFVGVNSVFSHVGNSFNTPGVVLFGPSPPSIWGHANNINLYKPLRCSPCLELLYKTPCLYSRQCMTGITVGEVQAALLRQLSKSVHT